ncbi:MAG: thiamine pyrophosphate-dependent enzyme, partial [Chloroflexota bacterium]
ADLQNPDFMALANAYGVEGIRVDDPFETGRAVANAIDTDRPVVVEVPVGRMPRPAFFPERAPRPQPSRR